MIYKRKSRVMALILSVTLIASSVPFLGGVAYAETVPEYDYEKAVKYAMEHYNDGGTSLEPEREDCTQFVRECFEAGGVPKDSNRVGLDGKPYGYTVDDYAGYLVNNGYAELYELKLEKQEWNNPQWYVRDSDNEAHFSKGDGVAYYCPTCKKLYHMSIHTGVNEKGFVTYAAQNKAVNNEALCTIECSNCGTSRENIKLYSIHITSQKNGYETLYNNIAATNLKARRSATDKVTLTWDKVSGALGYKVFVKPGKDKAFKLVANVKDSSYVFTENKEVGKYYFIVKPYFVKNGKTYVGKVSNIAYNNEELLPPANFKATYNEDTGRVSLSWEKVDGAVKYEVCRSYYKTGNYTSVFSLDGFTYTSEVLLPNTKYFYKIKAISDESGVEPVFSEVAEFTTSGLKAPKVQAVSDGTQIKLSWDKVIHADKYEIYRGNSKDGPYTLLNTVTGYTFTNKSVTPGKIYYYKVIAKNSNKTDESAETIVSASLFTLPSENNFALSYTTTTFDGTAKEPTVKANNLTAGRDYTVSYKNNINVGTATVTISGAGKYTGVIIKEFNITPANLPSAKVELSYTSTYYDGKEKKPTVKIQNLKEGTDFTVKYSNNVNIGTANVVITGKGNYTGTVIKTFTINEGKNDPLFGDKAKLRLSGLDRYATAIMTADAMKKAQNIDKFDTIVVADGLGYADALSGTYLAAVKNAPILTVGKDSTSQKTVKDYILKNLKTGGKIYILGGVNAVTSEFESTIKDNKISVKRLGGLDRYSTNLLILEEAGVGTKEMLICSATGFADSLSASATGKPILLVGNTLSAEQKAYLGMISKRHYYVIGGTKAVSTAVENQLKAYGTKERLTGDNRFETSVAVAKEFFKNGLDKAVLAYALNFPDGLSGGPLAYVLNGPLLLVTSNDYAEASKYVKSTGINHIVTLGGTKLISDATVSKILD